MLKTVFLSALFVALVGLSLASHVPEDDEQDPNSFVDSIFQIGVKKIQEKGSIEIPGEHKLGPFGIVVAKDIGVSLENIVRRGDASIRGDEDAGVIYINTTFTLRNVHANSSFDVNLPLKGPMRVTAQTTIDKIDMTLRCEYDPIRAKLKPTEVHIDSYSGAVTKVDGLGPLNPIVEKMATISADLLEKIISSILNATMQSKVEGVTFQIPQQH